MVDVGKGDTKSHFYINFKAQAGFITVDGRIIKRNEKKEGGVFFDLLSRVESQIPAATTTTQSMK